MRISQVNNTNYRGVKLANAAYEHANYVQKLLKANGVDVAGHKSYLIKNDFVSKRRIADFVREQNDFVNNECGIVFFPGLNESWIISNKFFEQKIKKILDSCFVDSEINLGI